MLPTASMGGNGGAAQSFLGTRGYLAPEMLKREAYSASVDVWALGVISFILLCGCLPFDDDAGKLDDEAARTKFQLRFPHWAQNISADAKDFLGVLLNPDARTRATAAEALEHRWLSPLPAALPVEAEAKKKLLASPKHIRSVPRTPQRNLAGVGPPERTAEAKAGGIGSAVGQAIKRTGSV